MGWVDGLFSQQASDCSGANATGIPRAFCFVHYQAQDILPNPPIMLILTSMCHKMSLLAQPSLASAGLSDFATWCNGLDRML